MTPTDHEQLTDLVEEALWGPPSDSVRHHASSTVATRILASDWYAAIQKRTLPALPASALQSTTTYDHPAPISSMIKELDDPAEWGDPEPAP